MEGLISRLRGVGSSRAVNLESRAFTRVLRVLKAKWNGGGVADRLYALALVACLAIGIAYRTRGVLFAKEPFWLDECAWGVMLLEQPLRDLLIRPIGFMAISKLVATHISSSEIALRMLPWISGVLTVLAAPFLAQKLFTTRAARLFFVAALAFSPDAIDRSREFKPYAVGLFLHLVVLLLAVRYLESRARRDLLWTLGTAIVAALFTQDIMFAYPGLFLALAVAALSDKRWKDMAWTAGAAAAAAGALVLQYVYIWSRLESSESEYWGKKYNVFFLGKGIVAHASWQATKYLGVVGVAGRRRGDWSWGDLSKADIASLMSVDQKLWLGLHVLGVLVLLFRRRFLIALLLLTPLLTTIGFNIAGLWPWGPFRTNLFTLAYTAAIAAFAFDALKKWKWGTDLLPAIAVVILPAFLLSNEGDRFQHSPTHVLRMREIVRKLVSAQGERYSGPPETLILDELHCDPWAYYSRYQPRVRARFGDFSRRFTTVCAEDDRALELQLKRARRVGTPRIWVLRTVGKRGNPKSERFMKKAYDVEEEGRVGVSKRSALRLKPEPD